MKHFFSKFLVLTLLSILGIFSADAANITHNGINYSVKGNNATIVYYERDVPYAIEGEIVIPASFIENGINYNVIGVGSKAFKGCDKVTKFTFEGNIKQIGANAFENCTALKHVILPETCVKFSAKCFYNCTALETSPLPQTTTTLGALMFAGCTSLKEAYIPASITRIPQTIWAGCTLDKITFADSETALQINTKAFGDGTEATPICSFKEVYYGRPLDVVQATGLPFLFRGNKSLETLVIGEKIKTFGGEEFAYCPALKTVKFAGSDANFEKYSDGCFNGCTALEVLPLPAQLTSIPSSLCMNCSSLRTVTLGANITSVGSYAFANTKLTINCLPEKVQSIGRNAFENALAATNFTVPAAVTSIGDKAFFNCAIENITLPDYAEIGTAALGLATIKTIKLTNNGTAALWKLDGSKLLSADGKTLLYAISNEGKLDATGVETVLDYAAANSAYSEILVPNAKTINYCAFQGTKNLKSFAVASSAALGTHVFLNSGIREISFAEGFTTIPVSTCEGCTNLVKVTLPETLNVMMNNCFAGCSSLKEITLGKYANYLEGGSIPATIETIVCKNFNVPVINETLFTEDQSSVVCKVPQGAVEAYKAAAGWKNLNIQGDASIGGEAALLGCPTGLYFATSDCKLMYQDTEGNLHDTGVPAGEHAFQLGAAHNRVYVGSAGSRFTYQSVPDGNGDGETFYINKSGDNFFRVTLVSNIGYHAFQDPFSLSVDAPNHKLLVADRNVGVHLINIERPGLYGEQPFLLQNNWLPWYGSDITYGAIGCGIERDSEGIYWMGKKFNGNGIFRFSEKDIYPNGGGGNPIPFPVLFNGISMSTFTLDEANGFLYCFAYAGPIGVKPGVYRMEIAKLKELGEDAKFSEVATLIDDAPVLVEGSAPAEITGITQISSNGENVYWSYIAPETAEDTWIGKEGKIDNTTSNPSPASGEITFDPANPLHKSGIKYISAKGGTPEVKYAVENVKAYGCAAYVYNPDYSGVESALAENAQKAVVKGAAVEVAENAAIRVIAINGAVVAQANVAAGSTYSLDNIENGIYLVQIAYANGTSEVVKVVK